jgi:transposase InsO family protein
VPDKVMPCPVGKVRRQFQAPLPNQFWASDFTYVAFVVEVFARRIVGWRASPNAQAGFVLYPLAQAPPDRRPVQGSLVHHDDRRVRARSADPCNTLDPRRLANGLQSNR